MAEADPAGDGAQANEQPPRMLSGIKPPAPFSVNNGVIDDWKTWRRAWVSRLDKQQPDYQTAVFLHTIGTPGLKIYNSFEFNDDARNLKVILQKFNDYAIGELNETYERYKFNKRSQKDGENFETYLASLRTLAKTCSFEPLTDSLIRDRVVYGIQDEYTRKLLLQESKFSLAKCAQICKATESADTQVKAFKETNPAEVNKVISKKKSPTGSGGKHRFKPKSKASDKPEKPCKYCGNKHVFDKTVCPAYGKQCNACGLPDHYAKMCKQKTKKPKKQGVKAVNVNDEDSDSSTEYINLVSVNSVANTPPELYADMIINDKAVTFQLDNGAEVNILPKQYVDTETGKLIEHDNTTLQMWNKSTMAMHGKCRVKLRNPKNQRKYSVEFKVVDVPNLQPLLGYKACKQMELITINHEQFTRVHTCKVKPEDKFGNVFGSSLGSIPGDVHLPTDASIEPSVLPPRRLPHAMKARVKQELDSLVEKEVIAPVPPAEPTQWVSQFVVSEKKNGKLRVCIDPKPLNKALKRNYYQLPVIDDILPELSSARVFSKLDLTSAFWQLNLDDESSKLTCFNTPFGRFRWRCLPFGLSVSSEIFQHRLNAALEGLPGVICVADDIVVYGKGGDDNAALIDHDAKLTRLLERCSALNIKLNRSKSVFRTTDIPFLAHRITKHGLGPDPQKVEAVLNMPVPEDVQDIQRFVGFVNYLSRYLPSLSDVLEPLRQLTRPEVPWHWTHAQQEALDQVKRLVTAAPVLAYYNPECELSIQCDASGKGLGAALLQQGRPIAYASSALTDTETRYASIEREMLAVVFALERFHQYTFGRRTNVISDHKPLEVIVKKPLVQSQKRLQGKLLRLQKYDFDIDYCPGKHMYLADTLSRAVAPSENLQTSEIVNMVTYLPIREERLEQIKHETELDEALQMLKHTILNGWPENRDNLPEQLTPYFSYRDELVVQDGLVFKGHRVIIPQKLRGDMKLKVHASHLGVDGCLRRARRCMFWPNMASEIKHYISTCDVCRTFECSQQKEPLMAHELASRPWERIGTDLFTWNGKDFLVTVDYYSNFWEIDELESTTSETVIEKLKAHFARYGSPTQVVSDNGPQYTSEAFARFAKAWDFEHVTSSPGNSQANGKAESAVKTAKRILTKTKKAGSDPFIALLDHRNTPTQGLSTSPSQRLMNRRTRTLLPTSANLLQPRIVDDKAKMKKKVDKQAEYFNKSSKKLQPLEEGDTVRMKPLVRGNKTWEKAVVSQRLDERSYLVETSQGLYRRNRVHLRKTQEDPPPTTPKPPQRQNTDKSQDQAATTERKQHKPSAKVAESPQKVAKPPLETTKEDSPESTVQKTRSGRAVKTPSYLKDYV